MKFRLLIFSLLAVTFCNAQNLVVNGSFEQCNHCPTGFFQLAGNATGWQQAKGSCDYFNACANAFNIANPDNVGVPINSGTIYSLPAYDGNAYAGFLCSYSFNYPADGIQEILRGTLQTPLVVGTQYYVSFKTVRAFRPSNSGSSDNIGLAVNKIGVLFTNIQYTASTQGAQLPNVPFYAVGNYAHVYTNNIITDTLNWTTISGTFVADSAYNYFLLGHLWDFNSTSLAYTNYYTAYYFVDDVCISADSMACGFIATPIDTTLTPPIDTTTTPPIDTTTIPPIDTTTTPPIDTTTIPSDTTTTPPIDTMVTTSINTFLMPTAFSPNGDNVNDIYRPVPANTTILAFRIYNRWGQKIYEASGSNAGWDGKYKGEPQPVDVYAYYIEVKLANGKTETKMGSFTLLR